MCVAAALKKRCNLFDFERRRRRAYARVLFTLGNSRLDTVVVADVFNARRAGWH